MATPSERATITVPAAYLEDAASAITKEVELDAEALHAADPAGPRLVRADPAPRHGAARRVVGRRRRRRVVGGAGQRERAALPPAGRDGASGDRLVEVMGFGPVNMDAVLEL